MEVLSCWFLVLSQKKDLAGLPPRGEPADHVQLVETSALALLGASEHDLAQVVLAVRGPLLALSEGIVARWFGDETTGRRFRRVAG